MLTGSHVDTTLNAGRYDGVVGVLGAIEAVRALRDEGVEPRRSIEVVAFAGEEPRFGTGCIGSRAVMGDARPRRPRPPRRPRRHDASPTRCADAGLDPDRHRARRGSTRAVHAFVELHIEQGAVLETSGEPIGVVEAIAAPHDFRVTLRGAATHAGATPMHLRRDALAGAAEAMVELERLARESPQRHHGRHRRRHPRPPRRHQRRAGRGRARRRRPRLRSRRPRADGRRVPGRRSADRRPARARARRHADRRGHARRRARRS